MGRTFVFNPTEFDRARTSYYHKSPGDAWVELLTELSKQFDSSDESDQFALGIPSGIGSEYFRKQKDEREAIEITLPPRIAGLFNNFYYAIVARLREEYEIGLSDGTNLLKRLASGEITVADVDAVKRDL